MPGKRQNITVSRLVRRGVVRWIVNRVEDGARRRTIFVTKKEADAEAVRLRTQIENGGAAWLALSAADRDELVRFHRACQEEGVRFWDLLRAHEERAIKVGQVSPRLSAVIEELLTAKRAAGRSDRYIESLRSILSQFASGRESLRMSGLGVADVERWLEGKNPAGRSTFKSRLSTLFSFAVRRGYRHDNPCDAVETPTIPRATPTLLTVRQTARCLLFLRGRYPRGLAWFILSTFCGLRPEEAERTAWPAIEIDNGEAHVRVEAQTSKIRQRRIVTLLPAAVAWLKIARELGSELPISRQVRRRTLRRLRDALRWETWPKDITRHTAATYWLALDGNPMVVAEQLGHSVAQLKTHYRALVTRAEAERFWKLIPRQSAQAPTPGAAQ